jgi:uncharacterized protein
MNIPDNEIKMIRRPKKKIRLWMIIALMIAVVAVVLVLWVLNRSGKPIDKTLTKEETVEPKFVKEGELFFINISDTNKRKKIDIEIADDEATRNKGLMFRRSMADTLGMLFVFEDSQPRNFWMENTYIPLDIIFVSEKHEIINIQKDAVPFSEASIPSEGNAQYVIEVNAGFTANNGLKPGDRIRFIKSKNQ